ncbi:MAG TPA: hypothetical protein VJJ75_03300 [Candidatus Nanoarchaeia archaeon]|nr:hypothetical protein [Candidatus Nanoarchaeia archaeon]
MLRRDLRIDPADLIVGILYHRPDVTAFSRRGLKIALEQRKKEAPSTDKFRRYIPSYPIMGSSYQGADIHFHFFHTTSQEIAEGLSQLIYHYICAIDNESTMHTNSEIVEFIYADIQSRLTYNQQCQLKVLAHDLGHSLSSQPMPRSYITQCLRRERARKIAEVIFPVNSH